MGFDKIYPISSPFQRLTSINFEKVSQYGSKKCLQKGRGYESLQHNLISPLVLALPRHDGKYTLNTDAYNIEVVGILLQEQENSTDQPTEYCSCSSNDTQRGYAITLRECYAVVWAVLLLRRYLP